MATDNKAVARRLIQTFGSGDTSVIDEIVAPDFHSKTRPMPGTDASREGLKKQIQLLHEAFPDLKVSEEDVIAEGDAVYIRWSMEGTNTGNLSGLEPTGKKITHSGQELLRFRDGKIIQRHGQEDTLEFEHKLGLDTGTFLRATG